MDLCHRDRDYGTSILYLGNNLKHKAFVMRLGQMARKLGVSQAEIIRYLSGQNMGIEEGGNVKLEEQHIRQLYAHFAPTENFETKSSKEGAVVASPETAEIITPDVPKGKFIENTLDSDDLVLHEGNTISAG